MIIEPVNLVVSLSINLGADRHRATRKKLYSALQPPSYKWEFLRWSTGRTRKCTSILHCNCNNSSTTSSENYLLYHHQAGTSIPTDLNCPNWGSKLGCQNSRHSSSTALLLLGRGGLLLPLENRSPSFMLHFCETGLFISKLLFLGTYTTLLQADGPL